MRKITIIGGGIAGLSLGIVLRENDVPVRLVEARAYPRHKVCGELISGHGLKILGRLGTDVEKLGTPVRTISFHFGKWNSTAKPLPEPALAIPRVDFDWALMRRFVDLGGELDCPARFQTKVWEEGYVCATGRRIAKRGKFKWYGLKGHVDNVTLASDLEFHLVSDGYVGLCNVGSRGTNICGLFRRGHEEPSAPKDVLGHFLREPSLGSRLARGRWREDSLVAIAGLPIEDEPCEQQTLAIGDSFSMTPPFTGNGMSLALESAALAASHSLKYALGGISWSEAKRAYQADMRRACCDRISFARRVQALLVHGSFKWLLKVAVGCRPFWHKIFFDTR